MSGREIKVYGLAIRPEEPILHVESDIACSPCGTRRLSRRALIELLEKQRAKTGRVYPTPAWLVVDRMRGDDGARPQPTVDIFSPRGELLE